MEFVRFIFSSCWVWLGFVILVGTVCAGVADVVKSCRRNREVKGYRIGQRWTIEIKNATAADVQQAVVSMVNATNGETEQGQEQEGRDNV